MNRKSLLLLVFSQSLLFADSVREKIGDLNLVDHLKGEIRIGYIGLNSSGFADSFAVGGHLHLKKRVK